MNGRACSRTLSNSQRGGTQWPRKLSWRLATVLFHWVLRTLSPFKLSLLLSLPVFPYRFVFVFVNSCHHVLPLFKLDPSVLFRVSSIILGTIPHRHYKIFWQAHLLLEVSEWTECYVFIWFRIRDFFLFCPSSVLSSRKKDGFLKIWPPWRRGKNNS